MLIVKVCVNDWQIDEIHIQRVESLDPQKRIYEYKIRKPEGLDAPIYHVYGDGWEPLVEEALRRIIKKGE